LRTWFTDRLGGDHTDRFSERRRTASTEVATVTEGANSALRFAEEHGTDLHLIHTGRFELFHVVFIDFGVRLHDDVARNRIKSVFDDDSSENAITHLLDDFTRFDERGNIETFKGSAIRFI